MAHAIGFWFIAPAALTFTVMLGALLEGNGSVTAVLGTLAAGSAIAAIAFLTSPLATRPREGPRGLLPRRRRVPRLRS